MICFSFVWYMCVYALMKTDKRILFEVFAIIRPQELKRKLFDSEPESCQN